MNNGLLEREHQVKLILLTALAGEHTLLIGPPGRAKSELAKRLKDVLLTTLKDWLPVFLFLKNCSDHFPLRR